MPDRDDHRDPDEAIVAALRTQPSIELAVLFGSLATGRAGDGSDVDLAVDAGRPLSAQEKIALISEVGAATGRPVDLVDLHTVGEPLLGEILRDGRRLLGSDPRYAEWICRHLHDAADFLPYVQRMLAERRTSWLGK
jgi:predicted nucleotidyltransferase